MEKNREAGELHEIKSKRRPRAVKVKHEGLRLRPKRRMKRMTKALVSLTAAVVLGVGVYGIGSAFFRDPDRNVVNLDYGSVSEAVEEGEVYSLGSDYSAIDIFARLNWTFAQQTNWYAQLYGTVDTVVNQEVITYKQYNDGILISADFTKSTLVSGASQFCYLKDRDLVIWRKPVGGPSTYQGLDTVWKTDAPYRTMTIGGADGFKATNGLPAYELCVYVIRDDTVLSVSDVEQTEDGNYRITYTLDPRTWEEADENGNIITKGATAYYANQMIFTGGLPSAPVFKELSVTYTFDENWRVLQSDNREIYDAQYGPIAAGCDYVATTVYEYNTPKAESSAYEDYFKQYANVPADNTPVEEEVTALDCLAEAFGPLLSGPSSLDLGLTVDGRRIDGAVNLDLSGLDLGALDLSSLDLTAIRAKARLGAVRLWLEDGQIYLGYGGVKVRINLGDLLPLVSSMAEESGEEGSGDLLSALAGGTFTSDGTSARLQSVLPLAGLEIGTDFRFTIGEESITLDSVAATIPLGSTTIGAELSFGSEELPDLSEEESYADLLYYLDVLKDLFSSEALGVSVRYQNGGISADGDLRIDLGQFALDGKIVLDVETEELSLHKTVGLCLADGTAYLDLDGVRLQAGLGETAEFLGRFLPAVELPDLSEINLAALIETLLSPDFAEEITSSVGEDGLKIVLKGTELSERLGIGLDLGDVIICLSESGLKLDAFGAAVSVAAAEAFTPETDGYFPVIPFAEALADLFSNEAISAEISYSAGGLTVGGGLTVDLGAFAVQGELTLGYAGASKTLGLCYADGELCLSLDGIRIKASLEEAMALIGSSVGAIGDVDAMALLEQILALDFGQVILPGESEDALVVVLKGTEILSGLGIGFDLGDVTIAVSDGTVTLTAQGAEVALSAGTPFEPDTQDYIDIMPYVKSAAELFASDYLSIRAEYLTETLQIVADLTLDPREPAAGGTITLGYAGIEKTVAVVYREGAVYLALDGLKISADLNEAVDLIKEYAGIPAFDLNAEELLKQVLGMDLSSLIELKEADGKLSAVLAGKELLGLFGIEFDLGKVEISLSEEGIAASAAGATVTVTEGKPFEPETDDFVPLMKYVRTVADMIAGGYLTADVTYTGGELTVTGKIDLDLHTPAVQAVLMLGYAGAEKTVKVTYLEGTLYLDLDGVKVSAELEEAVSLITEYVKIPSFDFDAENLLKQVLDIELGSLIKLEEADGTLSVVVAADTLLSALGVELTVGDVTLTVSEKAVNVKAAGAEVSLHAGDPFEPDTRDYVSILPYVGDLLDLLENRYLTADVTYEGGELTVTGKIDIDLKAPAVQAVLTLGYAGAEKKVKVTYFEGTLYLDLDGVKVSASLEEAVALITEYVQISDMDFDAENLLKQVLDIELGSLIKLKEADGTLSVVVAADTLLSALGVELTVGDVTLTVSEGAVNVKAAGAEVSLHAGDPFEPETDDFVPLMKYVRTVADMIAGGYLTADVTYTGGELTVTGKIDIDLKAPAVQAVLTLSYGEIEKTVTASYLEGKLYLILDGYQLSADLNEAIALIKEYAGIPAFDLDAEKLLKEILNMDLSSLIRLSEADGKLSAVIAGKELLGLFGIEFGLDEIMLTVSENAVNVKAAGAEVAIYAGTPFTVKTKGYIELVKYIRTVADMIAGGYLTADISYHGEGLTVSGKIDIDLKAPAVQGTADIVYEDVPRTLRFVYAEGKVYLDLDGIRLSADLGEVAGLITEYFGSVAGPDLADLLGQILSEDLGTYLTRIQTDGSSLSLVFAGDAICSLFGLNLSLGDVGLTISDSHVLILNVLGADITVAEGRTFVPDCDDYTELAPYLETLLRLFTGDYLTADVTYEGGGLTVSGKALLDLKTPIVRADLVLGYAGAEKKLSVIYKEGGLYLDLDGIRLFADVKEAVDLITDLAGISPQDTDAKELLSRLLSLDFGKYIDIGEAEGKLTVAIAGTRLLKQLLDVDYKVGKIELTVDSEEVTLSALGATVSVTEGGAFDAETDGYVPVMPYVRAVADMIRSNCLLAEVNYADEESGFTVSGQISLVLKPFKAAGTITLSLGDFSKEVHVVYAEDGLYLTIDGLKVGLTVSEAVELLNELLPGGEGGGSEELIRKILSLPFADLLKLGEGEGTLSAVLDGDLLLSVFGVEEGLGKVTLSVKEGEIAAAVHGATVTIRKGEAPEIDPPEAYADLTDVLKKIPAILQNKAISLAGTIALQTGETLLSLEVYSGVLSWKDGFSLYFDAGLTVSGSLFDLSLSVEGDRIRLAYGALGAELTVDGLKEIGSAFTELYARIRALVSDTLTEGNENPLPELGSLEELFRSSGAGSSALASLLGGSDWTELLKELVIDASSYENGIFRIGCGGLTLELLNEIMNGNYLGLWISYEDGDLSLDADLLADVYTAESLPVMPEANYLTAEDFIDALDYVGAAVDLLCGKDFTMTFGGDIRSEGVETYVFDGSIAYHSPNGYPIHLDPGAKNFWIDTGIYLKLTFDLTAQTEDGKDLYFEIVVVNSEPGVAPGSEDNYLDFYITVSQFKKDDVQNYDPLRIYAPGDELLTVLAGVADMFGVEEGILQDYLVRPWLSTLGDETMTDELIGSLRALGDSLLGLFGMDLDKVEEDVGGIPMPDLKPESVEYVKDISLSRTENGGEFYLALGGEALFHEGADDLIIRLGKQNGALTELSLGGISFGKTALSLSAELTYDAVDPSWTAPERYPAENGYFDVEGVDRLIMALSRSVTHKATAEEILSGEAEEGEYLLNRNFYIDGEAALNLHLGGWNLEKITVRDIALSVDVGQDGKPVIRAHLAYDGFHNALGGLTLGDSDIICGGCTLDLAISGGMVYLKRTQLTHWVSGILGIGGSYQAYDTPIVLYRTFPLSTFQTDYLNQLCFMFNLSTEVINRIMELASGGEKDQTVYSDLGGKFRQYVSSCSLDKTSDEEMTFTLNLYGQGLTRSSSFGDIPVTLGISEGYLQTINAQLEIVNIVHVQADLRYRNPNGVMTDGRSDITDRDLLGKLSSGFGGMVELLDSNTEESKKEDGEKRSPTWEEKPFLEAQDFTVHYRYVPQYEGNEAALGDQNVFTSTGADGSDPNALYGTLLYPDLSSFDDGNYYGEWTQYAAGDVLPGDGRIIASQEKHLFEVLFRSAEEIDGWTEDASGGYIYRYELEYGAEVTFKADGREFGDPVTVTAQPETHTVTLPEKPPYKGDPGVPSHWTVSFDRSGVVCTVLYDLDTVNYVSAVQFTVPGDAATYVNYSDQFTGANYTLLTPSAEGYVFLGWYRNVGGRWEKVSSVAAGTETKVDITVEALWAKTGWVTLNASLSSNLIRNNYSATAVAGDVTFVGAMAEELVFRSVEYAFAFDNNADSGISYGAAGSGATHEESTNRLTNHRYAHVKATATYVDGNGDSYTVTQEAHDAF